MERLCNTRINIRRIGFCGTVGILIIIACLLDSCRTPKSSVTSQTDDTSLYTACYPWESVTFNNCKLNVSLNGKSLQMNGNIYARRDSVIYFRGVMLVEVLRGVIYRDSFAIINRLERICYKGSNDYLQRITGYPVNPDGLMLLLTADRCEATFRQMGFESAERNNKMMLYSGNMGLEINTNAETQNTESIISAGGRNKTMFRANFLRYTKVSRYKLPNMIEVSASDDKTEFKLSAEFPEILVDKHRPIQFVVPNNYKIEMMR